MAGALIPTYQQRTTTPSGFLTTTVPADTSVGSALQGAGSAAENLGDELMHRQAQTDAKQADINLTNAVNNTLYTGDDAYMSKQGRDAVSALPNTMSSIDKAYQDARANLSGPARLMFDQAAQARIAGWRGDLQAHAVQQNRVYQDTTSIARQNLMVEDAARYAGVSEAHSQASLESAKSELVTRLEHNGMGADVIQDEMRSLVSKAYGQNTEAILARDPNAAQDYLNLHVGDIDPLLGSQLGEKVKALALTRNAHSDIANLLTSGVVPATAAATAANAPAGTAPAGTTAAGAAPVVGHPVADVIRRVWQANGLDPNTGVAFGLIESGLRDVNNGSSMGYFQISTKRGPNGEPSTWDSLGGGNIHDPATQADHAAKYYIKMRGTLQHIGIANPQPWQVYLAYQQGPAGISALFKGDPNAGAVSTLQAAGVDNAAAHIERNLPASLKGQAATITNAQFAQTWQGIFTRKAGGGLASAAASSPVALSGGQAPLPDLAALRAQVTVMAGGDPVKERVYNAELESQYVNMVQDRQNADLRAVDAVQPYLRDTNVRSVNDIPAPIWAALPEATKTSIYDHFAQGGAAAGYARTSDPVTLANLRGLQGTDPGRFANTDMTGFIGKLSQSDYDSMLQAQVAVRTRAPVAEENRVTAERITGASKSMLEAAGIKGNNPDGASKTARFQNLMFQSAAAFKQAHGGRNPTDQELQQMADGLMLPTQREGWFGPTAGDPIFLSPVGHAARIYVPKDARTRIVDDFKARFRRPPREVEVEQAYRQAHALGMFK